MTTLADARKCAGITAFSLAALTAPVDKGQAASQEGVPLAPPRTAPHQSLAKAGTASPEVLTNLTLPTFVGQVGDKNPAFHNEQSITASNPISLRQNLLSLLGTSAAVGSMGWYYLQVRKGTTASNLVSASLFLANDTVLFGSALMTPDQGLTTRAVYGVFTGMGVAVLHAIWRQNKSKPREAEMEGKSGASPLSKTDRFCIAACSTGLLALAAAKVPLLSDIIATERLALFGAFSGAVVNLVAAAPLIKSCLSKPTADEKNVDAAKGWFRAIAAPIAPWMLGTTALAAGVATVEQATFATMLSPVALLATNVALTTSVGIWAYNRLKSTPC